MPIRSEIEIREDLRQFIQETEHNCENCDSDNDNDSDNTSLDGCFEDGHENFEVFYPGSSDDDDNSNDNIYDEIEAEEITTITGITLFYDPKTTMVYHENTIDHDYGLIGRMVEVNPSTQKFAVKYNDKCYMITYPFTEHSSRIFCIITKQVYTNEIPAKWVC